MDCKTAEERISFHVHDGLEEGERERLERHLQICGGCTRRLEDYKVVHEALRTMPEAIVPGDFLVGVRQGLERPPTLVDRLEPLFESFTVSRMATATALRLAMVGWTLLQPGDPALSGAPAGVVAERPAAGTRDDWEATREAPGAAGEALAASSREETPPAPEPRSAPAPAVPEPADPAPPARSVPAPAPSSRATARLSPAASPRAPDAGLAASLDAPEPSSPFLPDAGRADFASMDADDLAAAMDRLAPEGGPSSSLGIFAPSDSGVRGRLSRREATVPEAAPMETAPTPEAPSLSWLGSTFGRPVADLGPEGETLDHEVARDLEVEPVDPRGFLADLHRLVAAGWGLELQQVGLEPDSGRVELVISFGSGPEGQQRLSRFVSDLGTLPGSQLVSDLGLAAPGPGEPSRLRLSVNPR